MSEEKQPSVHHTYTPEFKSQLVQLYQHGKRKSDIFRVHEI